MGALLHVSRFTRPELSRPAGTVASYLDYWGPWPAKECEAINRFIKNTVDYGLTFKSAGDDWESLSICGKADAAVGAQRSEGGDAVLLIGKMGGMFPLEWSSCRFTDATTSSEDAEALQWSKCTKRLLQISSMVNMSRMVDIEMEDESDSQALLMALKNGCSKSMGHLRLYGDVNFELLSQLQIAMK